MARIYCTHKLQKFIGNVVNDIPAEIIESKYGDWNGNLFYINKRKYIVLTNNLTHYSIILQNILKNDLKKFDQILKGRVTEQLINDKIIDKNDQKFVNEFIGKWTFYKTNNDRRITGTMNDIIYNFKSNCIIKYKHISEMNIVYENGIINTMPTVKPRQEKKQLSIPNENLKELKNLRITKAHMQ